MTTFATVTEKLCCKCRVVKPRSEFHRHRAHISGLQSRCKPCQKDARDASLERRASITTASGIRAETMESISQNINASHRAMKFRQEKIKRHEETIQELHDEIAELAADKNKLDRMWEQAKQLGDDE